MNKKKVLVTGATGFIGKHLVGALNNREDYVYSFSKSLGYDVCDKNSFSYFIDKKIDIVFHLAGKTFVPDSWEQADIFYRINTIGTQHVLDFCKKSNARLIYVSSYVYGIPQYLPIDEKHPVLPSTPYSHSKWLGEELCKFYGRTKGVKGIILRPFNIFGKGQCEHFLIPCIVKQIKEKETIEVRDKTPKRDYLYISDFIQACLLVMDCETNFDVFNVGHGTSFSVKHIIETIIEYYGKNVEWFSHGEIKEDEIDETVADYQSFNKVFGWKPKISFREGIKDMLCRDS